MKIIKGRLLTQPRLEKGVVVFLLQSGRKTVTVIRQNREDQKRDILFLCVGQLVALWTQSPGSCVIAEKIRIINYRKRKYLLPNVENKEV